MPLLARLAAVPSLLFSDLSAQTLLITFEEPGLTAMANSAGSIVPQGARVSNQFLASHGVSFESDGGFVAVVNHGPMTPSVPNVIGGTATNGALNYSRPITLRFFVPTDPSQPGTTDFVRVRGDLIPLGTGTVTLQAFAIDDTLLGTVTVPDVAPGATLTASFSAPGMHRVVLLETSATVGFDNVEFLPPRRAAEYAPYGSGCAGALGVPVLTAAPGSLPLPGTTFEARIAGAPLGVAVMISGLSDTQSGGLPLPLPLDPIGMNGCTLFAEALVLDLLVAGGTTTTWTLALPGGAALLGLRFYNQGLVLDPAANGLGFTISNAAVATIGS